MSGPRIGEQFATIFQQSFGPEGQQALRRAEYVSALRCHDWSYEYSDDHRMYVRGRDERAALNKMAQELDTDYALWNANAPEHYKRVQK